MSTRALILAAILLVAAAPAAATRRPSCGGWDPVKNVSNPHIQELGSWAVAEHVRRANDGLRFGKVTSAQEQLVSGMNYKLYLDAADAGGDMAAYAALVYEQEWTKTRELTSFGRAGEMARDKTGTGAGAAGRCLE